MKRTPITYLRSYRLRWGLSQKELSYLLGWKSEAVVSRIEKKQRAPSTEVLIATYILFGTPTVELFPGLFTDVEKKVMARVWEMYDQIQGDRRKQTRAKIELLEDAIERAKARKRQHRV